MEDRQGAKRTGADHGVLREVNRSLVLDELRARSPQSRSTLAKVTGLTKPTVSTIVEGLIDEGLVTELGHGRVSTEGGRPPILLEFNARSSFVAGIHVGVQRTNIVLADARGVELIRDHLSTRDGSAETLLAAAVDRVRRLMVDVAAPPDALGAIGVCVPGLVDQHQGSCLLAPNLGWSDVPVRALVSALSDTEVFVHNTAQACAVAETIDGAAKGASDVVLLYAGTGVGAGILSGGRLFHGSAGIAGEVGHCRVTPDDIRCACGKLGCLEAVASVPAILAAASRMPDAAADVSESFASLIAAADRGEPGPIDVLSSAGEYLGAAAAWLVNLFNPEVLIVGGAVAAAGEHVLGPVRRVVSAGALSQSLERVSLRPWALGQDAKARGAVLVGMQGSTSYTRVIFGGNAQ